MSKELRKILNKTSISVCLEAETFNLLVEEISDWHINTCNCEYPSKENLTICGKCGKKRREQ